MGLLSRLGSFSLTLARAPGLQPVHVCPSPQQPTALHLVSLGVVMIPVMPPPTHTWHLGRLLPPGQA